MFSFAYRFSTNASFALLVATSLVTLASIRPVSGQAVCLPSPRLLTTMPMGGQAGSELEVTITGQHLDGAEVLRFSHPAITATAKVDDSGNPISGKYLVKIDDDCPVGVHEARVMTRLGISSSRVFSVGDLPEVTQVKPNTSLDQAMPLQVDSICNGVMSVKQVDHYRFEAEKGKRIVVDCAAKGIDSKLNAVLIVADEQGRDLVVQRRGDAIDFEVPETGSYTIKVHELTFKGGADYFYRLSLREVDRDGVLTRLPSTQNVQAFSWPPAGLSKAAASEEADRNDKAAIAQPITLPCDLAGSFFPAADVDTFEFEAKKGEVWWVEVASERLGRPTDPSILVQHVAKQGDVETLTDVAELSDIPSPVKVSSNGYSYDGPPYNAGSSDILGKIDIKQDGTHRLHLTDLFGGTRNDPRNVYRLIIRQAKPDFALVAWALHMNLRNGDRNALSKPIALRGGATMPLEVVAIRRDGFDGEIELSMENLPDGVTASGLKIPSGQSRGIMLLSADEGAPRGVSDATFTGTAKIAGEAVNRPCRLASMAWPVANAWSEVPAPRLLADLPVSVGVEVAPITIAPREKKVWEAEAGGKLTIPLVHFRRSEFSGASIGLKAFGNGFERLASFDVPLTADSSEAVIDLAKIKTPPGDYLIAFYGSAVAKHRHNIDAEREAKLAHQAAQQRLEDAVANAKTLADQAAAASGDAKGAAEASAKSAAEEQKSAKSALAVAAKRMQVATTAAKAKDIVDIIVSEPIAVRVKAAAK